MSSRDAWLAEAEAEVLALQEEHRSSSESDEAHCPAMCRALHAFAVYGLKSSPSSASFDLFVLRHGNGLAIVGVAPSHRLFENLLLPLCKVTLEYSDKAKQNTFSGKRKRGALRVTPETKLAEVQVCVDDHSSSFQLRAGVYGSLVEVNHDLEESPVTVLQKKHGWGWFAVVKQNDADFAKISNLEEVGISLLTATN